MLELKLFCSDLTVSFVCFEKVNKEKMYRISIVSDSDELDLYHVDYRMFRLYQE